SDGSTVLATAGARSNGNKEETQSMANVLTDPPFAADPPVKINVSARILGLVIGILAAIGAIFTLFVGGLFSVFTFGVGSASLWLIGVLIGLAGEIFGAVGGFQMY